MGCCFIVDTKDGLARVQNEKLEPKRDRLRRSQCVVPEMPYSIHMIHSWTWADDAMVGVGARQLGGRVRRVTQWGG